MRKIILFLISLLFIPVRAEEGSEISVTNNLGVGNISINLKLEQDYGSGRIKATSETLVEPGMAVKEYLIIKNEADEAWIRAKVDLSTDISQVNIQDIITYTGNSNWIEKGGYFYYKKPVKQGKSIELASLVKFPAEWEEEKIKNKHINYKVTAEAVQAKNFMPKFEEEDPWFGTIIEIQSKNYTVDKQELNNNFEIAYEGGSRGLVKIGDDFFSNFGTAMPGDTLKGKAEVKNNYTSNVELYFRTENSELSELEKVVQLKIYKDNDLIFGGKLGDVKKEVKLAFLKPGDRFELRFELYLPKEMNNKYSLSKARVRWVFKAVVLKGSIKGNRRTGVENTLIYSSLALLAASGILIYKRKKS